MPETTPRPWGPDVRPTAEQLLDWLLVATREEQLELIGALQQASQTAHDCFQQNHVRRLEHHDRVQRARIDVTTLARANPETRAHITWRFLAPHITDAAIEGLVGQHTTVLIPVDGGEQRVPARILTARRDGDSVLVTLTLPPEHADSLRALTGSTDMSAYSIGTSL